MVGSRAIVRALRAMGAAPHYTEYPNEEHVIWHHAYATPQLLPWLLDQHLRGAPCDFDRLPSVPVPKTDRSSAGARRKR